MLGLFMLSIAAKRYRVDGIARAVVLSILLVLIINEPELLGFLPGMDYDNPLIAWPWLFPIGSLTCFALAFRGRPAATASENA